MALTAHPMKSILPNGSALDGSPSQVLKPQQHGKHSFELAVEMDLVAPKPHQLVRIERVAECLLADQRTIGQFLLPVLEPRQHLAFEEAAQALDIGGGWLFAFSKFVWIAGERVWPLRFAYRRAMPPARPRRRRFAWNRAVLAHGGSWPIGYRFNHFRFAGHSLVTPTQRTSGKLDGLGEPELARHSHSQHRHALAQGLR